MRSTDTFLTDSCGFVRAGLAQIRMGFVIHILHHHSIIARKTKLQRRARQNGEIYGDKKCRIKTT